MPSDKAKVNDEVAALLCEEEIGPYKLKPWSFGRFKKVLPAVLNLLRPLKEMGLTLENAEEILVANGLEIIMLLPEGLEALSTMIEVTLDIPGEEVEEIDLDQIPIIGLAIISQNLGRIKNSLPLIMDRIKTVTRAT